MPAPVSSHRPVSLATVAAAYGVSSPTVLAWERQGVDVLNPIALMRFVHACDRGQYRIDSEKCIEIAHRLNAALAAQGTSLDQWFSRDPAGDC